MRKYLLSLLLCLLLTGALFPTALAVETRDGSDSPRSLSALLADLPEPSDPTGTQYYFYRQLNDVEKALYFLLKDSLETGEYAYTVLTDEAYDEYDVSVMLDNAQIALKADCPYYSTRFVTEGGHAVEMLENGFYFSAFPRLGDPYTASVLSAVDSLASDCRENGTDSYSMLLEYFTFLNKQVEYGFVSAVFDPGSDHLSTAKGCLVNHTAICDGFAQATKMLCDRLGIPCLYVWGTGAEEAHAWNYIQMEDGCWYQFDGTNIAPNFCDYASFCEMLRDGVLVGTQSAALDPRYNGTNGSLGFSEGHRIFSFPEIEYGSYRYPSELSIPEGWDGLFESEVQEAEFFYSLNEDGSTCTITAFGGSYFSGDLIIPSVIDGYTVTGIGDSAFYRCTGINGRLVLPDTLKEIGWASFLGCTGLHGVLEIPSSVEKLDLAAFAYCSGFTQLVLSDGLKSIGRCCFYMCNGFSGDLLFPESVEEIGQSAFFQCLNFDGTICWPDQIPFDPMIINQTGFASIELTPHATNYATSDGMLFSADMSKLLFVAPGKEGSLVVPEGVTEIGDYACDNLLQNRKLTGTLTLPSTLKRIGDRAFIGHTFSGGLVLPDGLEVIDEDAFETASGGFTGDLIIPDSVRVIGHQAFPGNFNGELVLSNSLTVVELSTFADCHFTNETLVIPANLTKISNSAFNDAFSSVKLVFEGTVETIGDEAFFKCGMEGELVLPEGLKEIGARAFEKNSLSLVKIPESVETIGEDAFDLSEFGWGYDPAPEAVPLDLYLYGDSTVIQPGKTTLGFPGYTTIYGVKGSTAEAYAKEYGYMFIRLTDVPTVPLNETRFPDAAFCAFVSRYDLDENGSLSRAERAEVTDIDCSNAGITSLQGIEYFFALRLLCCSDNQLSGLDIRYNSALSELDCSGNQLSSLDISECPQLMEAAETEGCEDPDDPDKLIYQNAEGNVRLVLDKSVQLLLPITIDEAYFPDANFRELVRGFDQDGDGTLSADEREVVFDINCQERNITSLLGLECFPALHTLNCMYNQLSGLDVTRNTALIELRCSDNALSSLDLSQNTALQYLNCCSNQLSSLDVRQATALTELYCGNNRLDSLDLSQNVALQNLDCNDNLLSSLDLSRNTALQSLACNNNQLNGLDLSRNKALQSLNCSSNPLSSLDTRQNRALLFLHCDNTRLSSLDISRNTLLYELYCENNQLSNLDLSQNTALRDLYCGGNRLYSLDLSQNNNLFRFTCVGNQLHCLNLTMPLLIQAVQESTRMEFGSEARYYYEETWATLYVDTSVALLINGTPFYVPELPFGTPDFILPAATEVIEESAFEGVNSMTVAEIPDGCERIGSNAFKDCVGLAQIRIPASVTAIDDTAFEGCEFIFVYGVSPSAAEAFCDAHPNCCFVSENAGV